MYNVICMHFSLIAYYKKPQEMYDEVCSYKMGKFDICNICKTQNVVPLKPFFAKKPPKPCHMHTIIWDNYDGP